MSEIVSAGAGASKKNGSVQKRILKTAKKVRDSSHKTRGCGPRVPFSRLLSLPSLELDDRGVDHPIALFFFFFCILTPTSCVLLLFKKLFASTGKAAWIVSTTFLVLVVPLIIETDREQQLVELEQQQMGVLTATKPSS